MKSYLEIKEMIVSLFLRDSSIVINEENDIILFKITGRNEVDNEQNEIKLINEDLKKAYSNYTKKKNESLQLYDEDSFEIAVDMGMLPIGRRNSRYIKDIENKIEYRMGEPSYEYFIMLLDKVSKNDSNVRKAQNNLNFQLHRINMEFARIRENRITYWLQRLFRIQTLHISSQKPQMLTTFQSYAKAYEYLFMYKTRQSLVELSSIDMIFPSDIGGISRATEMDEPPKRKVNTETLEYYSMALEARDPFTKYISFYHVIEYHFDEVYRKRIIEDIRDKITDPGFSYKSDKCVYELAKFANTKMKNSDNNGRGNELDSLKYVLTEYVPIDELKQGLNELNSTLVDYYAEKTVTFAGSKAKIQWNDTAGVYTTLAKRIYETRNSLVHSKSEQSEKQYKPQKHRKVLNKEIPLVQVIAERIIFASSSVL